MSKKAKSSGRGGAREGAGRPKELKGEVYKVTAYLGEDQAVFLDELAEREGLRGRSAALRWLIDQARD